MHGYFLKSSTIPQYPQPKPTAISLFITIMEILGSISNSLYGAVLLRSFAIRTFMVLLLWVVGCGVVLEYFIFMDVTCDGVVA